jgi:hypothetical protein
MTRRPRSAVVCMTRTLALAFAGSQPLAAERGDRTGLHSLGRARAPCRPFSRWDSLARPPNRTCDSHRFRLSTNPYHRRRVSSAGAAGKWIPSTLATACALAEVRRCSPSASWHSSPPAAGSLPAFAMWSAFPTSDYYEGSAPSRNRQSTTDLPRRRPGCRHRSCKCRRRGEPNAADHRTGVRRRLPHCAAGRCVRLSVDRTASCWHLRCGSMFERP